MRVTFIIIVCLAALSSVGCGSQDVDSTATNDSRTQPSGNRSVSEHSPRKETRTTSTETRNTTVEKDGPDTPLTKDQLKTDAETAAFLFALHDLGDRQLVTQRTTAPYRTALDELTDMYNLNHGEIANATLAAVQPLDDKNIGFTYTELLAAMKQFSAKNQSSYAELLATYTVLREKGTTHDDTVQQIDAFLNALFNPLPASTAAADNSPALVGTGIKEKILILAMNANANLEPKYHHDFQLVSKNEDKKPRSAIYRDKNSGLILIATGPSNDLTLLELWMPLEEFVAEENGQATGEGAAAFGRCVQRLGFAADPSWSEDLYNWMNQQMARALLTPDGVYTARKDFVAKFGTLKVDDDKMMVTMTIGRVSKSN